MFSIIIILIKLVYIYSINFFKIMIFPDQYSHISYFLTNYLPIQSNYRYATLLYKLLFSVYLLHTIYFLLSPSHLLQLQIHFITYPCICCGIFQLSFAKIIILPIRNLISFRYSEIQDNTCKFSQSVTFNPKI